MPAIAAELIPTPQVTVAPITEAERAANMAALEQLLDRYASDGTRVPRPALANISDVLLRAHAHATTAPHAAGSPVVVSLVVSSPLPAVVPLVGSGVVVVGTVPLVGWGSPVVGVAFVVPVSLDEDDPGSPVVGVPDPPLQATSNPRSPSFTVCRIYALRSLAP